MNLYRGCLHNCAYCDGRAEGYYVEGEFGSDVDVKINAPNLVKPRGKYHDKRILLSSVTDPYNSQERKYSRYFYQKTSIRIIRYL